MTRARVLLRTAGLLAIAASAAACARPTVVRVVDGVPIEGPFVAPSAYSLYAAGAVAEASGDLQLAHRAYQAAAAEDRQSPHLLTRLGAVRCRLESLREHADAAFQQAHELDPGFEPLWRERARCDLARGRAEQALAHASAAVALDPGRVDTAILVASILERLGRLDDARRELHALVVREPRSLVAHAARLALARRSDDAPTAEDAAERLDRLLPRGASLGLDVRPPDALTQIDRALLDGDLASARAHSRAASLSAAELGVRAAALGRVAEAREQADLVLAADPSSSSARITLAVAADLGGDPEALARAWDGLPTPPARLTPASPLARLLLAELLARRIDLVAARAWLGSFGETPADADPVLARTAERVRERLGR